jgi:hypothetical protein
LSPLIPAEHDERVVSIAAVLVGVGVNSQLGRYTIISSEKGEEKKRQMFSDHSIYSSRSGAHPPPPL